MESSLPPSPDLLLQHARFVRLLAHELLKDEHAAADLVQETWLRALRRPPRKSSAARAWLRSVTSRLSIEGLRSRARSAAREEGAARPEALPSVSEELAHTEVLRSVAEAVLTLDEPYRTTVLLAYWRDWDARRIAAETDTPLATVRSRLQRAHAKLRERLDRGHGREAWAVALLAVPGVEGGGGGAALLAGAGALCLAGFVLYLWSSRGERSELLLASSLGEPAPAPSEGGPALQAAAASVGRSASGSAATASVFHVRGTVQDLACAELALPARPAAGLELKWSLSASEYGRPALQRGAVRTDEQGRFEWEVAEPGPEKLFLLISSSADASYRGAWHRGEFVRAQSELALTRVPHGVLPGTVVDERGAPLAGIALTLGGAPVTSGPDGTFALANAKDAKPIEVVSRGWALLGNESPKRLDAGGYSPLTVHLGPGASLRVRLVDGAGAGIACANVSAMLPPGEQALLDLDGDPRRWAETDAHGVATLDGLWAERKLRLSVALPNEQRACEARAGNELLVVGPAEAGRPIVLARGESLELVARIAAERDVAGLVFLPDGAPAARAKVEVADLGAGNEGNRPVLLSIESDAAGRFAGHLRAAALVGPLRVTASLPKQARSEGRAELEELGYAGPSTASDLASLPGPAAHVELAPDDVEKLSAIALTLAPRLAIRGLLRGRDGAPVKGIGLGGSRIWAAKAGSLYHGHGVPAHGPKDAPGVFEISGLEPGVYDLFASEELQGWYTFENFLQRFPGIPAGAGDLELRLGERREARIRVRLNGAEPSSTVVLQRKLFAPGDFSAPRAEHAERVRGSRSWPAGTVFGFTGVGGSRADGGQTTDGYDEFEGAEHALAPLEPGWYSIGVCANGFFPLATRVLWFDEGEYVVDFELQPEASLRGRVLGATSDEFLAVTLLDEEGAPVTFAPTDGFCESATVLDLSATGEFALRHVSTGSFRLRYGSRAELARGEFRREVALELRPGENAPVELRP